jgi:hypothetical protein
MTDRHEPERVIGNVGSKLLFEDDRVRVWELRLATGERSAVHRHDLDYIVVQVAGDRIAVEPEPDSSGEFSEFLTAPVTAGAVIPLRRGGIETAVNVGGKPYHEVIIELKD